MTRKLTKLTVKWLENPELHDERYDVTVPNLRGLVVRVHPSGVVSFRLRYKRGERAYVLVLGEYGHNGLSLADVHDMHSQAMREIERGLDPIEERAKRQHATECARREQAEASSVEYVVEQFAHRVLMAERWDAAKEEWVRDAKSSIRPRKRPLEAAALLGYRPDYLGVPKRKNLKPTLVSVHGKDKARDLTKRQLIALLDQIVDRGAPVTANRAYALLKQMFNFAAAKDLIPASPMAGIEKPGGQEKPRRRRLTVEEIRTFWTNLETAKMAEVTKLGLKLLLVTAQRRGEIANGQWSHIDFDARLWTIPVELQKTEDATRDATEPHKVPLSPLAIQLLERLKSLAGHSRWIMPSPRGGKAAPYSASALSRAVRANSKHFGLSQWQPHDLRRTAASCMTMLKIPRLHVEKVLNHATSDIAEVYDRHDYLDEKRAALERWAKYLENIIAGKEATVVQLPVPERQTA